MNLSEKLPISLFNSVLLQDFADSQMDQLEESRDLQDLIDIRDSSAYKAFVKMIGGLQTNMNENGYEILAKEYKKEIKYSAGNLMELHLKDFIDRSL